MQWNGQNEYKKKKNPDEFLQDLLNKPKSLFGFIIVALLALGIFTSFYTVQPEEEGVVTFFGKWVRNSPPGLHFKWPYGVEQVTKVKTARLLQECFGHYCDESGSSNQSYRSRYRRNLEDESLMLTGDLNVADVQWVVQYRINDPKEYLFNVHDPIKNIHDISQAAMRRAVGDRTVTDVLTVGRGEIASEAQRLTQEILDQYQMGITIDAVRLQTITPPEPVKPSFNDVNSAKQEQEQDVNQAEAYYNKIIPEARGQAEEQITRAEGYAAAVINRADGDAKKFTQILKEYEKAPEITRTRLYLDLIEDLLGRFKNLTVVDPEVKGVLPLFGGTNKLAGAGPQVGRENG